MRSLLTYILLIAVFLPSISPWGTIAYYQLNKDYIVRVLCENRNKPQLHCDGKCYLAKRLKAQQNKQDKQTAERIQNISPFQLYCEACFHFDFGTSLTVLQSHRFAYQLSSHSSYVRNFLRRPRLLVNAWRKMFYWLTDNRLPACFHAGSTDYCWFIYGIRVVAPSCFYHF
ncbi:MAG: hypothetical protein JWP57_1048 [Spirosoma sp.]|nr:hypothetical protein [Spirosoma sp.]